ncbi:MAG TPA: lipoprotein-releasing ABC transporter permease subunit [Caulobacteraceae bacterium]|nr:lipoprotein-releasing ABC transporter permease subunit [Caulobacteraceae bacterium]
MNPDAVKPAKPFSAWETGLALRYLRAKRKEGGVALISIISFVGIMLAVAVLIIVMSVMNGFRTELLGRILGFNGHAYVQGAPLSSPERDAMLERLRRVPGVVQVSPLVENQAIVTGASQVQGAIVRGVDRRTLRETTIVSKNIRAGSAAGFGEGEYGGEIVLMGEGLAAAMGFQPGDAVTLISPSGGATAFGSTPLQKSYTLGGVFSVGMSEYDAAFVYMPLEQAQLFFGKEGVWDVVEILVEDPDAVEKVKPLIRQAAGPGAIVTDWRDRNQSFFDALQIERNVMRLILMLIVFIAAMNIISGLVMLVKNKGRDIAILRTMGASRGAVMRVFFVAGASIGVAGTLAGLLVGTLFCAFIQPIQGAVERVTGARVFDPAVYFLSHIPARVEWTEVLIVTFWSLLAACLATLPPAWRASRLDPVEALRYE